jgi:ACT domain-containing protein
MLALLLAIRAKIKIFLFLYVEFNLYFTYNNKNYYKEEYYMKAVVSVIGKDGVGIMSNVSTKCAEVKANIVDVSQTIMQEMFCMVMLVEIDKLDVEYTSFVDEMEAYGKSLGLTIHVMHEDIFNSMHTI